MQIQYLGHAGFIVTTKQTKILIDPWFHAAFLGSWFPYPDNRTLEQWVLDQHFDCLYISHTHEDHFDKTFLQNLRKDITVLCPNYRSGSLSRKLQDLGFTKQILLGHRETFGANDLTATIYLDVSHKEDSGLLLESEGFRFLDLNDCNTTLTELPTDITLLAAQFSGAMWYPNCYDYAPDVMQVKTKSICDDLMNTLGRKIQVMKPKYYLPCAGPPCFLDPELQKFNDAEKTIFPTWDRVAARFAAMAPDVMSISLQAGDEMQCDNGVVNCRFSHLDLLSEVATYSDKRRDEWDVASYVDVQTVDVRRYFTHLARTNAHLFKKSKMAFRLRTEDKMWTITLGESGALVLEGQKTNSGYEFNVPSFVLHRILSGETGWEEALLSMRVGLHRDPDVYDVALLGLLRYGNEAVQTAQMLKDEQCTETVTRDEFCFQRYCPHAGEDLTTAIIENGIIECPRHHWKWDLNSGECRKGGNLNLKVQTLPGTLVSK